MNDSPLTRDSRVYSKASYQLALEDVIFACLFADHVKAPPTFPAYVDGDAPGETLVRNLQLYGLGDVFNRVSMDSRNPNLSNLRPEQKIDLLLTDARFNEFQQQIFNSLAVLGDAYDLKPIYWDQYIAREAVNHLGSDPSIFSGAGAGFQEIKFGAQHYIDREKLNHGVSPSFVKRIVKSLRSHEEFSGISDLALDKFARVNAATHVFSYWEPHAANPELIDSYLRRPYITRSLMRTRLSQAKSDLFGELLDISIPFISYYVLTESGTRTRNDIPTAIARIRKLDPHIEEYRKEFCDACLEHKFANNSKGLEKLVEKTIRLVRARRAPLIGTVSMSAGFNRVGTANVTRGGVPAGEWQVRIDADFSLRALIQEFSDSAYDEAFVRLFPEFARTGGSI